MKIYEEIELASFDAWSGARDTMDTLNDLEDVTGEDIFGQLESMIDEFGEGMSAVELNDFLWFETDTIAEWLGYSDWETLEKRARS